MSDNTIQLIVLLAASLATCVFVWEYHRKREHEHQFEQIIFEDFVEVEEGTWAAAEVFVCACGMTHEKLHIVTRSANGSTAHRVIG
jgi:hypothetical protein